jgi:hypothetical protein
MDGPVVCIFPIYGTRMRHAIQRPLDLPCPSLLAIVPHFFSTGFAGVDAGAFAGGAFVASVDFAADVLWLLMRSKR